MRIAFLTMGKDIGGAAQDVITLSQGLANHGHEVFVLASRGVLDVALADTTVKFIDVPLYTRNLYGLWKASREIRKYARKYSLDILNPQGMYPAFSSWLARFGLRKQTFRIVTTIHMISSLSLYKYSRILNTFSEYIITESYCERNRLVSYGVDIRKVRVVSNSVDMNRFSTKRTNAVLRDEYKIPDSCFCFGIVARLSREKRHSDFIAAAKIVHGKKPDTRFFIVGDGPEKERILKEAEGCEEFIFTTGSRNDIPDILKSLDCFVLNSEVESLPLSIREAMSMSLPVIATDVGGIREAVLHGITGLVVPSKNSELLAEAMIQMAENKELAIQYGEAGHSLCMSNFELSRWVAETEKAFRYVMNM